MLWRTPSTGNGNLWAEGIKNGEGKAYLKVCREKIQEDNETILRDGLKDISILSILKVENGIRKSQKTTTV